jgi:hypothetical protein
MDGMQTEINSVIFMISIEGDLSGQIPPIPGKNTRKMSLQNTGNPDNGTGKP